ncbi:MAG TPA: DUF4232 domain-containing protein [Solirubrobacteraceae bacterium]|nr:DUF4232 domain-containing protein [Solirubrobacteraceae bacterium]
MKRYLPLLLVGALAGCGSTGSTRPGGRAATLSTRSTITVTTSVTSSPGAVSTASTATSAASTSPSGGAAVGLPCGAANLSVAFVGEDDAAGHGLLKFALTNTGSSPCHTYGFPGVQFLDAHGAALATVPHHITSDYFGQAPEGEVTILPAHTASFRIGVTHGAVPGSVCTTAYGLQVIPPDDTSALHASITSGAYECRDAYVSPVEPGSAAYGQ